MSLRRSIVNGLIGAARFFASGYDGAQENYGRGNLPWGRRVSQDEDRFLSGIDRETLRQKLLDMRRNVPIVKGLCDRMCDFVAGPQGIQVQAQTDDDAWNRGAEAWFADWCRACDVTGRFPFRKIQRALVDARLWAGESFPMVTDGMRLQCIEAERVRQPYATPETANKYDGIHVEKGVVRAWYVADRDDNGTFNADRGRWIPAASVYHFGNPWRFDMIRCPPELAAGVNVMTDIGEISYFTLMQIKKQAQVAGVSNTEGGSDLFAGRGSNSKGTTTGGVVTQKVDGAGIILRGLAGEKLDLAQPATPNPNLEGHLIFNLRQFCATVGIPYEVAMMDSTRGNLSQNKAVRELFSRVVETWQLDLADFVRWTWAWIIPQAWARGDIAKAPVKNGRSQWDRIEMQFPPSTWADPQDAADADAKNLQLGNVTHDSVIKRSGRNRQDVWRARAKEEAERQEIAKEFGVDPDKISNVQIAGNAPSSTAKPAPKEATP